MASNEGLIASRYVRALFDLAEESKQHDDVKKDMLAFKSVVAGSPELQKFLTSPVITREQAEKAMSALLSAIKAAEITRKFFMLLARQRRLALARTAIDKYLFLLAESRGELAVRVTSANKLGDAQLKVLVAAISKATGKNLDVKTEENPALIGGIQVRIGSKMLDHSIAGKLARLRTALSSAI